MEYGLAFASSIAFDHDNTLELCRRAAGAGFGSLWGGEHVIIPTEISSRYPYTADGKIPATPETPIPDPLIWLAFAAAAAPGLRLGTCILIVPQRNPVVLSKELATLDRLCGGGVDLGIGVGWMQEEFDAIGVPWARRGARTDEYIAAMRTLWSGPEVEFHGEFVDFGKVTCSPRPVQATIPIIVGGDTDAAMNRAVRLGDGWYPGQSDPAALAPLVTTMRERAAAAGRDPSSISLHVNYGMPRGSAEEVADHIGRLTELGVTRLMVPAFAFVGPGGLDRMDAFAEHLRAAC